MRLTLLISFLLLPALLFADSPYDSKRPSRDGTGKVYLGREISQVMGHLGAGWLERPAREQEERTDLLIANLPVDQSSVIADVGAGTGYFAFRLAGRVKQIYAVDIQQEMLDIMDQRSQESGLTNVVTVKGSETDPGLAEDSVDLIFIVDAYHEFSHPYEMGKAMVSALKPGGKLVLIEYRAEDRRVPIKRLHKMSEKQVVREMARIGLTLSVNLRVLPQQHFMIFERNDR